MDSMKMQVRICKPIVKKIQQSMREDEKRTGVKISIAKYVNWLVECGLKRKG